MGGRGSARAGTGLKRLAPPRPPRIDPFRPREVSPRLFSWLWFSSRQTRVRRTPGASEPSFGVKIRINTQNPLHRAIGGLAEAGRLELAMLGVLNLSDGRHALPDIAERAALSL